MWRKKDEMNAPVTYDHVNGTLEKQKLALLSSTTMPFTTMNFTTLTFTTLTCATFTVTTAPTTDTTAVATVVVKTSVKNIDFYYCFILVA